MKNLLKVLCISLIISVLACKSQKTRTLLFVGSYTEGKPNEGIFVYNFDTKSGELKLAYTENNIINPSYLKLSPDGNYLYSVTESQLQTHGSVSAFAVDKASGKLNFINKQDAGGRNPVHLAMHPSGKFLVNANYTDPSISIFHINKDGSLNPYSQLLKFKDSSLVKGRQDGAHIHSSNFSADGKYLFAQDLGADKIRAFSTNKNNTDFLKITTDLKIKPGSGPRHFTFHPNGKYGYSVAELSGKITAYEYNEGQLKFIEDYLSYSKTQDIYRTADVHISPDGTYLYASNRGPEEDSLSIFSINTLNGELSLVAHEPTYGEHPRNFTLDPTGKFLLVANQFSGNIVIFKRNVNTGKLTKLPQELNIKNPSSLQMFRYLK